MTVAHVIEEANCAAFSKYETKFPMTGMTYGTCGGFPLCCGIDVIFEVQLGGKILDSSILDKSKTRAICNIRIFEDQIGSRLACGKEPGSDSLPRPNDDCISA